MTKMTKRRTNRISEPAWYWLLDRGVPDDGIGSVKFCKERRL